MTSDMRPSPSLSVASTNLWTVCWSCLTLLDCAGLSYRPKDATLPSVRYRGHRLSASTTQHKLMTYFQINMRVPQSPCKR